MEDLAGLGVAPLIQLRRLERGQHLERLDRDLRPKREGLDRGDDRVAPEEGREPGHAGGDVALALGGSVVHKEPQVRDTARHGQIEQLVVGRDGGRAARPGVVCGRALVLGDPGRLREERRAAVGVAGRGPNYRRAVARPDRPRQLVRGACREWPGPAVADCAAKARNVVGVDRVQLARLREDDVGPAPVVVDAVVLERRPIVRGGDRQQRAAVARIAADLEDVGRVVGQLKRHVDRLVVLGEVHDRDPLLERVAGHEPLARDAELLAGQALARADLVVRIPIERRVRQLDDAAIVRPGRALENNRPGATDPQHRARQQSRVVAVEAESARVRVDVAELVGQQEHVAVLQDLDAAEVRRLLDRAEVRVEEVNPFARRRLLAGRGRRGRRRRGRSPLGRRRPLLRLTRHRRLP